MYLLYQTIPQALYTDIMAIRELRVNNVRSYELYRAEFSDDLNLILGPNGTGKTTLLEAIYYLYQGTSFRGRDRDMIAYDTTRSDLLLTDDSGDTRRASLQQTSDDKIKKSFEVEDRTSQRLLAKHRRPVVLFEPDELRLLSSSPDRRRRFFDGILARLYPQYATILARYQRTLLQRNELLKRREETPTEAWDDQLFVWDIKFSELALEITRQRREFATLSNTHLSDLYSQMAGRKEHVTVSYNSSIPADNYQQTLLNRLNTNRLGDSYRGYTSVGPHRDDFLLYLDGHLASESASRGEMRTIMLAYKLLEVKLQTEIYNQPPLILMDDVFSELDVSREAHLMQALTGHQTIITATDLRDELKSSGHILHLS